MAAIHDELEAEVIQYVSDGAYITRGRIGAGKFYVTGKRVVFLRQNPAFSLFGAIGGLLSAKVEPKKVGFDVPLSAVTGVEQRTFGRAKSGVELSYTGADKPAKFIVKTYETAVRAMKNGGANLP
jgi:hypothetical protein